MSNIIKEYMSRNQSLLRIRLTAEILQRLESLILATPSGDMRNQLCDINIQMEQQQNALERLKENG